MFFGEYSHSMDEKGRLRVPAKLKNLINGEYVVTKGTSSCLFLFPKAHFEQEFLTKLNNVPTFNTAQQKPIRLLLSSTYMVEEDGQGRFALPGYLKTFANLEKNVVFIGVGSRIEIWSEDAWNNYQGEASEFDDLSSALADAGI